MARRPDPLRAILTRIFALLMSGVWAAGQSTSNVPAPINGDERWKWFARGTVGPQSLAGGAISAGSGTLFNAPREYGTHWDGFGKRFGMRLTGLSVGNAMEAGLGSIWGEDPRYIPTQGLAFRNRVGHVVKMTFVAHNRDGGDRLAYARYIRDFRKQLHVECVARG
jgi:hypothetical protein